jgi:hypothetical protein
MTAAAESTAATAPLQVAIYDDVVAARGEQFRIPGLAVTVFAHADDAVAQCLAAGFDVVFMDYALGPGRKSGTEVTRRCAPPASPARWSRSPATPPPTPRSAPPAPTARWPPRPTCAATSCTWARPDTSAHDGPRRSSTQPPVARELATLALSCVQVDNPMARVRAAAWSNALARLGVRLPLFVVHDLGVLLTAPRGSGWVLRTGDDLAKLGGGPREARALLDAYRRLVTTSPRRTSSTSWPACGCATS